MKKLFVFLIGLSLIVSAGSSLAQKPEAPIKTNKQWQLVLKINTTQVELDRVNSKGWETSKVNVIYRYRFEKPIITNMTPRDEEVYSVLIDCQKKEFQYNKKTWYYQNSFVYEYKYTPHTIKKITPEYKAEYEIASIACQTSKPDK